MNRYESYKDSGIPWLGEVPAHWEVKRLRFTVNLNPVKSELDIPEDTLVSFIPMEAVNFDKNLTLTEERNLDEVYKGYTYFKNGDVVLAKITPCFENGKSAIAQNLTNGIAFGTTELHVLRSQNSINNHFLYYLIKSDSFMKIGESEMYGAGGQKRIPEEFIKNFFIGLPPYYEQTAIAHYLDTKLGEIDVLIDKQQTLLEKLAEQRTAVITHAVTKGLNPAAAMKNSGVEWLGDVPAHWDVSPFKLVMNSIIDYRGKTPEKINSGVFLITARNIKNGIIDYTLSQEFIDEDNYEEVMRRGLPKLGQVLMTTEAPLGEVAQIDRTDVALAQRVLKFDGKKDKLDNRFLKYFILSKAFQASLYKFATGSTALGIKSERLSYLKSLLPPVTEQSAIANYLDQETAKIDRLCDTVNQTIGRLKEYRSALITQAVTGKIKVTDE